MSCDQCAAEPAGFDHLDLSGSEPVFKRLCKACAEQDRARWNAERRRRPAMLAPVLGVVLRDRRAA